ncbi:MAG: GNAT family N-acetyltransferase [Fluviicola sp.]
MSNESRTLSSNDEKIEIQNTLRPATQSDVLAMKSVVDSCNLFPSEYLDGMMEGYFKNPNSEELWFVKTLETKPVGIAYCVPEKFTEGTFNLLAIGVHEKMQGTGIGSEIMHFVENQLRSNGARILIVETSGAEEFKLTRKFYVNLGYTEEATIRDFWTEGEDKVIFWKKL